MRRAIAVLACVLVHISAPSASAQEADPVNAVVRRLERALSASDDAGFRALFDGSIPPETITEYALNLTVRSRVRAAIFERSRAPLEGVPPGDGFRLILEFFIESDGRARIVTAGVDIRRPAGGDAASWRISLMDSVSGIEGLYKLRLNTNEPLSVSKLELRSEDLVLALSDGLAYRVECDDGVTGMILIGRGELRFSPAPATERGQLQVFSGTDTLAAAFETAFVRFNPRVYAGQVASATMVPAPADPRSARRAQDIFRRDAPLTFGVDVSEMSRDAWHLLPTGDDFVAEVDTRRFDTLTYSRSNPQAEDVSLFRRSDRKTIVLYPSAAKLVARGRFYSDDTSREYDVLEYAVTATIDPQRQFIRGRTRLSMRIRSTAITTMLIRLADSLTVQSVASVEHGRLLHLRMRGQQLIAITFPRPLSQDADLTLVIDYSGRLESQGLDIDNVQPDSAPAPNTFTEPRYLLSNRSYWYPQNPIPDYATATLRITVPGDFSCVASGEPTPEENATAADSRTFAFRANQPLRYLALVVGRMTRVAERRLELADPAAERSQPVLLTVEANPRLQGRGRALAAPAEDILRYYASLVGEAPYTAATVALTENDVPGGHSPAYFSLLNEPQTLAALSWRRDPASFDGYPEFFLAHELAHQWWGQAVSWKNYHEQWLSEGFAQYFAALYAQKTRGERVFIDMLRQFRRWALEQSNQGPVYLGYRLGHIKSEPRVFRALVYNKGAGVLHMLRRLIGDAAFFQGLRLFYQDRRYQKAGTEDLERAMEQASGRTLDRFFETWIYGAEMPRVSYRTTVVDGSVTVTFEQTGTTVFDLPVTVRVIPAIGQAMDVVVPVIDKQTVRTISLEGTARDVQINPDFAALAEFQQR